jgi:pyruvate kinase
MDRRTKIIATIGPATNSPQVLEQLIDAGMNIARLNMSHATHEDVRADVETIRRLSAEKGRHVGILLDTQGPAIRTGDLAGALDLSPGQKIALTVRGEVSEEVQSVDVNYDQLVEDISIDDVVQVDNGNIQLKVLEKHHNHLTCEVLTAGVLGSRRHINLPGVRVNLPALTEKDMDDIKLGIEIGVDFFAMSFVREADDVTRLKGILDFNQAPQQVIAKLEDQLGVSNVDEIIDAADGIMIARGDLGIECPYEELPIIQRRVVKHCIRQGKPVIVATHMLESMIKSPSPTRAEITDVANAVFEQADAIMLSGETSVGKYPVKCIEIMDRVARRIERSGGAGYGAEVAPYDDYGEMVKSACRLAAEVDATGLIVFTETGRTARYTAWHRPQRSPIYAFTNDETVLKQLSLPWGTRAFLLDFDEKDPSANLVAAMAQLRKADLLARGDAIVSVTEVFSQGKLVDTVQMHRVE